MYSNIWRRFYKAALVGLCILVVMMAALRHRHIAFFLRHRDVVDHTPQVIQLPNESLPVSGEVIQLGDLRLHVDRELLDDVSAFHRRLRLHDAVRQRTLIVSMPRDNRDNHKAFEDGLVGLPQDFPRSETLVALRAHGASINDFRWGMSVDKLKELEWCLSWQHLAMSLRPDALDHVWIILRPGWDGVVKVSGSRAELIWYSQQSRVVGTLWFEFPQDSSLEWVRDICMTLEPSQLPMKEHFEDHDAEINRVVSEYSQ